LIFDQAFGMSKNKIKSIFYPLLCNPKTSLP
jgi:hypothetical protein